MTEHFVIPAALAGERIDRAVALLTGRSRAEITALVASGGVRIDGRTVTVGHDKIRLGVDVAVDLAEVPLGAPRLPAARNDIPFVVRYVDADVIVVDKPAGLVVHPGAGHADDTLVSGLLGAYPDLAALGSGSAVLRPGIVHRLDKDTSGLLVVARSEQGLESLGAQLADRSMTRRYLALCRGTPDADDGRIDAPIGRSLRDPKKMAVRSEGRTALTTYHVIDRFSEPEELAFLECVLSTGRTHQIRVHLAAIGHPIAGDRQYGGTVRALGLDRPFLHAAHLEFTHPGSGERMVFDSPLPEDLSTVLARLE